MSNGTHIIPLLEKTAAYACLPRSLKRELVRAQEEIKRIQSVPLVIGQFMEAIDQKYGRTGSPPSIHTDTRKAPALYNPQQAQIMSFEYSQPATVRSSSPRPPLPSIAIQTPSLIFSHRRLIRPLPCLVWMRSQTLLMLMLVDWTCRSKRYAKLLNCP